MLAQSAVEWSTVFPPVYLSNEALFRIIILIDIDTQYSIQPMCV